MSSAQKDLGILIRAKYPVIYIISNEPDAIVLGSIQDICINGSDGKGAYTKEMFVWDCCRGFIKPAIKSTQTSWTCVNKDIVTPAEAINYMFQDVVIDENGNQKDSLYVFLNFHHYLSDPEIQQLISNFCDHISQDHRKTVILLSKPNEEFGSKVLPKELETLIHVIKWPHPDSEMINEIIFENIIPRTNEQLKRRGSPEIDLNSEEKEEIIRSCQGLNVTQITNALSESIIKNGTVCVEDIVKSKKQIIMKSGLLTYCEPDETIEDIGGHDNLKKWLIDRKKTLTQEAQDFGCDRPRGVLFLGPWGSGKSTAAKVIMNLWGLPGLRIDAAKLFEGTVGSSERNTEDALALADAIAPCVSGKTKIILSSGIEKSMEEIWNECINEVVSKNNFEFKNLKDVCLISMDNNMKQKFVNAKYITRKRSNNIYEVTTSISKIEITGNHLWATISRDGNIEWKRTDCLSDSDYCICPMYINRNFSNNIFSKRYIPKRAKFDGRKWYLPNAITGTDNRSLKFKIPKRITKDIAYLAGLIESDGYLSANKIGFVNSNNVLIDIFRKKMKSEFGISENTIKCSIGDPPNDQVHNFLGTNKKSVFKKCFNVHVNSAFLSEFFIEISRNILGMTDDLIFAWLSGYLDGDGSIDKNISEPKIKFMSKSKSQLEKIRSALLRVGIAATGHTFDRIEVTSKRKSVFLAKNLNINHPNKIKNLKKIIKRYNNKFLFNDRSNSIYVPILLKNIYENNGLTINEISKFIGSNFSEYKNGLRSMPFSRFVKFSKKFAKNNTRANILAGSDFRFFKILSIKKIPQEKLVYDIVTCKDRQIIDNNFIANNSVVHNCILWWDEVDDLFSGASSSDKSDAGTTSRVIGTISTWLQEHENLVFSVFTANEIKGRPPKMFRKGRLDEIFIIDLPSESERKDIFRIHIRKKIKNVGLLEKIMKSIDIESLSKISVNFSGAEIRSVVNSAWLRAFNDGGRLPSNEDFIQSILSTIPFSCTVKEDIEEMRRWQDGRAVRSSRYDIEPIFTHSEIVSKIRDICDKRIKTGARELEI